MKIKKILELIGILGVFVMLLPINFSIGIEKERTSSIKADQDSFVWSALPDNNYGGDTPLDVGNVHNTWHEIYLHFSISDKPENWIKAELSIKVLWLTYSNTLDLTFNLVNESWNENTITWNNKPSHAEVIDSVIVQDGNTYNIDITNYIQGNDISICINASNSSEIGFGSIESKPDLIWTYTETFEVEILNPESSDVLIGGEVFTIEWNSTGTIQNVRIELYKNASFVEAIRASTPNDGSYNWNVPIHYHNGSDYEIKIIDTEDADIYGYSDEFSIYTETYITVTNPSSSDALRGGMTYSIRWSYQSPTQLVKIELHRATNYFSTIVQNVSIEDGSYSWDIPRYTNHYGFNFQVKIIDQEDPTIFGLSKNFTINQDILVLRPTNSDILRGGESFIITWNASSSIENVRIELYAESIYLETISNLTLNDGEFDWQVSTILINGSGYRLKIIDSDSRDVYVFSNYFSIIQGPEINGVDDGDGFDNYVTLLGIILFGSIGIVGLVAVISIIKKMSKSKQSVKTGLAIPPTPTEPIQAADQPPQRISTIPNICPICGSKLSGDEKFCQHCGSKIAD